MLAERRRELIMATVQAEGCASASQLAVELGVSAMTVRRDIAVLADRGLLVKVHGGATRALPSSTEEPGFEAKLLRERDAKARIARSAAELVRPGTAIGLTAGTTTWALAGHLGEISDLTIVTNSIGIAQVLERQVAAGRTVVLTGGVRTPSDALVGPIAVRSLASLHVDTLFMGIHAMSETAGYSTPNLAESETNRAFVAAADRLVVTADHTKWGLTGLAVVAPLAAADAVITSSELSAGARRSLETAVEVVRCV